MVAIGLIQLINMQKWWEDINEDSIKNFFKKHFLILINKDYCSWFKSRRHETRYRTKSWSWTWPWIYQMRTEAIIQIKPSKKVRTWRTETISCQNTPLQSSVPNVTVDQTTILMSTFRKVWPFYSQTWKQSAN